ncbi:MAG: DUF479 domain-containing protein [Fidelibacterota bacterium]|nr:MAG: DUF479 domain-containing protein [Candidatus Neomarinimicrobiota bacterium]
MGDFVKGDGYYQYSTGIQQAILLHRRIDAYSNTHPVYRRSKRRIHSSYRHTKGILVDLFYDHFLARDWDQYTVEPLPAFTSRVYQALEVHWGILPRRLQSILPPMATDDWLLAYRDTANIGRALTGLSRRLSHENKLNRGLDELQANYLDLEEDFVAFFPRLVDYADSLKDAAPD